MGTFLTKQSPPQSEDAGACLDILCQMGTRHQLPRSSAILKFMVPARRFFLLDNSRSEDYPLSPMASGTENDQHNLDRFVEAQATTFDRALTELKRGRKESQWMWYLFPQVAGLGSSRMAQRYAITSPSEAVAYLEHPLLGARLTEVTKAVLQHARK